MDLTVGTPQKMEPLPLPSTRMELFWNRQIEIIKNILFKKNYQKWEGLSWSQELRRLPTDSHGSN